MSTEGEKKKVLVRLDLVCGTTTKTAYNTLPELRFGFWILF